MYNTIGKQVVSSEEFDECKQERSYYKTCLRELKGTVRLCKPFLKTVEDCEFRMGHHRAFIEKFNLKADNFEKLFIEGGGAIETRFARKNLQKKTN